MKWLCCSYTPWQGNAKSSFALPYQGVYEQQSHFTEVRLSEREHYIFRPFIANPEGVAGGCEADIGFELVEGSTQGAQLFIVGDATDTRVAAMDYDASGRLTQTCDAEGACNSSAYDLAPRSMMRGNVTAQTDGLNPSTI